MKHKFDNRSWYEKAYELADKTETELGMTPTEWHPERLTSDNSYPEYEYDSFEELHDDVYNYVCDIEDHFGLVPIVVVIERKSLIETILDYFK